MSLGELVSSPLIGCAVLLYHYCAYSDRFFAVIISVKEIMFSPASVFFLSVCLLIGLLNKKCSTDFHNILWKGMAWANEERITFRWMWIRIQEFLKEFKHSIFAANCNVKGSSSQFRQQSENTQSSGPQTERINKGCRGGDLRCSSASLLV